MRAWLRKFFNRHLGPTWEYGIIPMDEDHPHQTDPARRHRKTGEVQFILWKAGEQGHAEDYWFPMNSTWWPRFVPSSQLHLKSTRSAK